MSLEERLDVLESRFSELAGHVAALARIVENNERRRREMTAATTEALMETEGNLVTLAEAAGVRVKWKEES